MKILWFSNAVLSSTDRGYTGTWLDALASQLVESGSISLSNISIGRVKEYCKQDCGSIQQWILPMKELHLKNGLPSKGAISFIKQTVEKINPDLIHIWGTELFWGLLTSRQIIACPSLLEMQGLKLAIAKVYLGGLTQREQNECRGLKEVLKFRSIKKDASNFQNWAVFEKEIINIFLTFICYGM